MCRLVPRVENKPKQAAGLEWVINVYRTILEKTMAGDILNRCKG